MKNNRMHIVQLIDSLDAGGAERMAVSYANALVDCVSFSALITTRKEGVLKTHLSERVGYLFLDKKKTFDLGAVLRLRKFVKQHKIQFVHAHSSSFFLAILLKITYSKVKIIWHDHHGNRVHNEGNMNLVLQLCSSFFYGVITVNRDLEQWAKKYLQTNKISYIPNFVIFCNQNINCLTQLKGENTKRIVFLANLRKPKNHLFFLEAFYQSGVIQNNWTLHIIGRDFEDDYSKQLKDFIIKQKINNSIFIYGSCNDIDQILSQADVGVLASTYEGFPVTLLEYGKASLAVLSTNVGYCQEIIKENENGLLFNPEKMTEATKKIQMICHNEIYRNALAQNFHQKIVSEYSDKAVIQKYLKWLQQIEK